MKTYDIPWMSEEETQRFLAEIQQLASKPKPVAAKPAVVQSPLAPGIQKSQASNLTIGGL